VATLVYISEDVIVKSVLSSTLYMIVAMYVMKIVVNQTSANTSPSMVHPPEYTGALVNVPGAKEEEFV
jgi:hypothetical protein